ncbi:YdeI/OmpD-associated family protein [Nonomuraea sp. NEAU-A123]|uniref:YdeI/OmpD-associated family protein n=1 Tax=Nonomuraea sp. NEAU-A123 TaxID=2839649 RepID=UPI001BE4836B|nr:YdeI/OmpD-associated family protein [Nonomuraea sp. NEAU-A123]MBT2235032.1 YdeI/OmpD-associated family protein [Nonomuraea sp. NEAU-A123]
MRFRAVVELGGKTATGIEVPADVVEGLGGSKRPAVNVTINGYGYRSTVASMGGRYMLPISAEHRQGAGVAAGDEIEVALELDTAPREVTVPTDLAAALDGAPEAKRFFDGLSYSRRLRYVLQVEGAKKAETRQRRIADTITRLANGEA